MDLMLFLVLVFSKTLVISHCLPQNYSVSLDQVVAPSSSAEVSTERARAAVISQALLSLLQDVPDSDNNHVLPPPPVTEKHSVSSLAKDLSEEDLISLNQDAETIAAFTTAQNSVLTPETMLDNSVLPVTKKQKKIGLPTEPVDSFKDFISWLHDLLKQAKTKKTEEEKNKTEEEKEEEKEENQESGMPTEKVESFSNVKSWLEEAVTEAKERNEKAKVKVEEVKQKLSLQKEKLDDFSNFRSWLQDAVTVLKDKNENEKEEEKQKIGLPAETVEGISNVRSWLEDAVTLAKKRKEQAEEKGEKKQKIGLPAEAVEGLNNIRSRLQEVLTVVKTNKEQKERRKQKQEGKEKGAHNTTSVGDSVMCFLCKTVMDEMKSAMDKPDMEKNMEDALENGMCPFIPEGLDCKTKVHTYCPILFEMIHAEMDPEIFCQDMTLCSDSASPQSGARALLDFLQHAAESRKVPHSAAKPAAEVPVQKSLLDLLQNDAESLKPSVAAAPSNPSAEATVQSSFSDSLHHAAESSKPSPEVSMHSSLLDVLKPSAEPPKAPPSSSSAAVFVQNAIRSLLSHLVSSESQTTSYSTDTSALSSESRVTSLHQPAPDSTDFPVQPTKPFDPDSVHQFPPPSGNLAKLVSTYLCRSRGVCGGGSQVETSESETGSQAGGGEAERDEDNALRFLPNPQHSQEEDPGSFIGNDYDFLARIG